MLQKFELCDGYTHEILGANDTHFCFNSKITFVLQIVSFAPTLMMSLMFVGLLVVYGYSIGFLFSII